MGTLQVNTSQMNNDAEGFYRISQVGDQIASYLQNALNGLGKFWGNDKVGDQFIAEFGPGINGLVGSFYGFKDGFKATGDSVNTSAGLYQKSNDVNSELAG
jgi:hypothetical protein